MCSVILCESNGSESFLQIHSLFQCLKPSSDLMQTCIEQQYSRVGIELRLPPPINLPFMNLSFCLFFYYILWRLQRTSRLCMEICAVSFYIKQWRRRKSWNSWFTEMKNYTRVWNQFSEPNTSNSDIYGSPKKSCFHLTIIMT